MDSDDCDDEDEEGLGSYSISMGLTQSIGMERKTRERLNVKAKQSSKSTKSEKKSRRTGKDDGLSLMEKANRMSQELQGMW